MEDFNIPGAERVALLERLQEKIGDVPPYFWASCQVCDLDALKTLVEVACISPSIVRILAGQTYRMIKHWTQSAKGATQTSTPSKSLNLSSSPAGSPSTDSPPAKRQKTTNSPILRRSLTCVEEAKKRDGYRCVLTGDPAVNVAHIYPFCWLKNNEEDTFGARHTFWECLKNFWPKEKVAAWAVELFPGNISGPGLERVYNLITLSPNAHVYWNRGAFALKPISVDTDQTCLTVQFFWQRKQNDAQTTISLSSTPFSTENLDRNEGAFDTSSNTLLRANSEIKIKSGELFELRTDDAIARPLPSFALLEMQWFLTRVVGMAGALGPYEEGEVDDDSDDEITIGGLDEAEDDEITNPGLDELEDDSLILSDPLPQDSSPFLYRGSVRPPEGSKHHTQAATEDGFRELGEEDGHGTGDGGQEIM